MLDKRIILNSATAIAARRPAADMRIEQYLMTPESMATQILCIADRLRGKTVFYLGDDDHMSVLMATELSVAPVVAEIDPRVRSSLNELYADIGIKSQIVSYDARTELPGDLEADAFYINPPYSSKNSAKAVKLWLKRASHVVPIGSFSVLIYPIDYSLDWTITCLYEIQDYANKCGLIIAGIDKDIHAYGHVPNDPGLLSSNIYLYKYKSANAPAIGDMKNGNLYR